MKLHKTFLGFVPILFLLFASTLVAQQKDVLVGTWKLNLEKTRLDPPPSGPAPQSVVRTFEDRGGGVLVATTVTLNAEGKKGLVVVPFKRDGKPYPVATDSGAKVLPMMAFKKIDAHHNEHTTTVDGKVVTLGTETISDDGKIYTEERKGTNAQGKQYDNVYIWERQ